MAIDDAVSRSKAVDCGTLVDFWVCTTSDPSPFEIIIESLASNSCGVALTRVSNNPPTPPDDIFFQVQATDQLPSGPHRSTAGNNFNRIELRALSAGENQSGCSVSYTFKWL
jgi:hypothetical protein